MKKLWTLMAMVAVFASCSQEEADSPLNTYTLTGYADVESRTAFGTPGTYKIPFQWSVDDYIYNGSNKSNTLSNGGSSADFTFSGTSSSSDVYYNISGTSAKQANVKTSQIVGNLGTNGDFGYGTVSNGSFTLKHATSYIWFDTTLPSGATLESITLDAGNVTIAGTATWNGSQFGTISNACNSINLTANKTSVSGAELAMVIFPATITNASVTYQLKINGKTKFHKKTISGTQQVPAGKTLKITTDLKNAELYELRVLTFEDEDCNGEELGDGKYKWSEFIPTGGQYGSGHAGYWWGDYGNTELEFTPVYGMYGAFAGHAGISNYVGTDWENQGNYMYDLQAYNVTGGHSGSNFNTHFGYVDESGYGMNDTMPSFYFWDGEARVIDHMWVTNTTYVYNQLQVCTGFGANYTLSDSSTFKIVAYGYESDNDKEPTTAEFYLLNTGKQFVTEWTKWDLSVLGKVVKVEFNLVGSDDMYGSYGFIMPAYFAYDDVAVRFAK